MTDPNPCTRHAALIQATLDSIKTLPPLSIDATPQSFPAYKASLKDPKA